MAGSAGVGRTSGAGGSGGDGVLLVPRLGGADAVKALNAARAKASEELAIEIDNAVLGCAEQLAAEGKTDEAAGIYESFYQAGPSPQLRSAGLRGLGITFMIVGLMALAFMSFSGIQL